MSSSQDMIIDCHVHLSGRELEPELVETAARLGVDRLCVSSVGSWAYEPAPEDFIAANNDVAALQRRYPGLVLGFCYLSPAHPREAAAELRRGIEELGMVGLKLWVAAVANDPLVFPLVEQAICYHIPVLQHAWLKTTGNLPHESTPAQVAELARRYPEADIIMAHLGGEWRRGIAAVRGCPNVAVDTSGSIMELGMVEQAVAELGAKRVIFGSDAHGVDLPAALGKVLDAEITPAQRRQVLGGNMADLLAKRSGL